MEDQRQETKAWIPLMEYAIKKGISLSTLRRHIKANKLTYKVENGRYLLWDEEADSTHLKTDYQKLEMDLKKAQEEIAELKTLIAFYEEKAPQQRLTS